MVVLYYVVGLWLLELILINQIPGVPIMYITQHKYSIERLPEATMGGGMLEIIKA